MNYASERSVSRHAAESLCPARSLERLYAGISSAKITRGIYRRFLCEKLSAARKVTSRARTEL